MNGEIIYVPFRNITDDKYGMNAVYSCDIQHEFSLVNDWNGNYHFELRCCGPMKIRGRLNQLCPNLNGKNGIGTYIVDLSEHNLECWKKRFSEYFTFHRDEIEREYKKMRKEDEQKERIMRLQNTVIDNYLNDTEDK